VHRANDSEFGLAASVWSRDLVKANRVARRIEAGMVWVNDFGYSFTTGQASWGGVKSSGFGRTSSKHGLYECVQVKYLDSDRGRLRPAWWFPYDAETERALQSGAEIVLHAYPNGYAPGKERLTALRLPYKVMKVSGTSEDAAFILAHGKGADLIVAVGSHGNLREFLDKGRQGMASTFLVRLRVGEILVDAKGVSRLYRGRIRGRDAILLLVAALVAIAVIVAVSPPLRLYVKLLYESLRNFVFRITH
jgi:hypothetical protein